LRFASFYKKFLKFYYLFVYGPTQLIDKTDTLIGQSCREIILSLLFKWPLLLMTLLASRGNLFSIYSKSNSDWIPLELVSGPLDRFLTDEDFEQM